MDGALEIVFCDSSSYIEATLAGDVMYSELIFFDHFLLTMTSSWLCVLYCTNINT